MTAEQRELLAGFFAGLMPEPKVTVSDWADQHRRLSNEASAEPGPWRTARTPYLREVMDMLSAHSPVEEVVVVKGAQLGFTEAGNNWVGYIIDVSPAPTLMVMPTAETMMRNSRSRITPLIEASPRLREKVKSPRARDSGNTLFSKDFPGGVLIMAGANSPAGLRSMPMRNLFLDEVDAYPRDLKGEGNPIDLAKARTRTFARRKVLQISTPTIEGESVIQAEFDNTDQRRFFVPCPHCDHYQILKFEGLSWTKGQPHTAEYLCEECGGVVPERYKPRMLAKGQWRPTCPENINRSKVGYHISSLYSPYGWYSWADVARDYEAALNEPAKMKAFVNTVLGEPYKEPGESPPWENLYNRRESYPTNKAPKDVCFITAGVDVQKDRIELEVVGWARGKRSYSLDYRVLIGDTAKPDVWNRLSAVVTEQWAREDGYLLPLKLMAIDTGYNTSHVYAFCQRYDQTRVVPVKGQDAQAVMVSAPKQVHVTSKGKKAGKVLLWNVGVNIIKSELYGWLRLEAIEGPEPDGFCHFPQYAPEFFKGLTAEQMERKVVRGYTRYQWVKKYERNEPLDCRVYARAAAAIVGIDRFEEVHWQSISGAVAQRVAPQSAPVARPKRDSGFWGSR